MTQEHDDGLAAEYVLGTLAGDERRRFAAALAHDPELQAQVEAWEQRLQGLGQDEIPVEPSAGLWDKIESALDDGGVDEVAAVTLRSDDGEWQQFADGIEKKILFLDEAARSQSYLLRFGPGARVPSHQHNTTEEILVLEGACMIGDLYLEAGDFHAIVGNAVHPETFSEHGVVVYVRGELRVATG